MDSLQPRTVALRDLVPLVCRAYAITPVDLISQRRGRTISTARQCLYYLARRHTLLSFPAIGRHLHRDHTSVLTGERVHAARIKSDPDAAKKLRGINKQIAKVTA